MTENEEAKEKDDSQPPKEIKSKLSKSIIYITIFSILVLIGSVFYYFSILYKSLDEYMFLNEPQVSEEVIRDILTQNAITTASAVSGSVVEVGSVSLSLPGYVVIHQDEDGSPGVILGHSDLLDIGMTETVVVMLERPVESGEVLYAMLHTDDGDAEFSFPGPDVPVRDEEGEIVMLRFEVEAETIEEAPDSEEVI